MSKKFAPCKQKENISMHFLINVTEKSKFLWSPKIHDAKHDKNSFEDKTHLILQIIIHSNCLPKMKMIWISLFYRKRNLATFTCFWSCVCAQTPPKKVQTKIKKWCFQCDIETHISTLFGFVQKTSGSTFRLLWQLCLCPQMYRWQHSLAIQYRWTCEILP